MKILITIFIASLFYLLKATTSSDLHEKPMQVQFFPTNNGDPAFGRWKWNIRSAWTCLKNLSNKQNHTLLPCQDQEYKAGKRGDFEEKYMNLVPIIEWSFSKDAIKSLGSAMRSSYVVCGGGYGTQLEGASTTASCFPPAEEVDVMVNSFLLSQPASVLSSSTINRSTLQAHISQCYKQNLKTTLQQ